MGEQMRPPGPGWDAARLVASEKEFWHGLWGAPVVDALCESGADAVRFGPVQAICMGGEPGDQGVNFALGAGVAGTVRHGHLADAVRWFESRCPELEEREIEYRVPVVPGLPESAAATTWLERSGHLRDDGPAKLVRDASRPRLRRPAGVEVLDWDQWEEGFGGPLAESLGLPDVTEFFFTGLLEEEDWRCYCAILGDDPLAYVAMHVHDGVAALALASRPYRGRDGEGQRAALHRCIEDALDDGCDSFVLVDAGGEPPTIDRASLLRAGFKVAYRVPSWRSPVRVVA